VPGYRKVGFVHLSTSAKRRLYEYRRRLPHYQKAGATQFVTFRTHERIILPPAARDLVLTHTLHEHGKRIELFALVVMPDHVHTLLRALPDSEGWPVPLSVILQSLKGSSAHSINRLLKRSGAVWQDESFDHALRSNEKFEAALDYIRQNPVRRGLVKTPEEYRWLWTAER
jgi:REP-associated tyrosine transposase